MRELDSVVLVRERREEHAIRFGGGLSPFERFRSDALARRCWHPEATYQDEYERPLKPYSVT